MSCPHPTHLRSSLALLLSLAIIAGCLVWPNQLSGRAGSRAAGAGAAAPAAANFLDDAGFFVRQHYLDFLGREPDTSGFNFWTNQITSCGANVACREVRRINVSAAFFLSIEFQSTGYLAYRAYKAAFGNTAGKPVPITRHEMLADMQPLREGVIVGGDGWEQRLEQNRREYFDDLVKRERFAGLYPQTLAPEQFVDALDANAGAVLSPAERDGLVGELRGGSKTRAQVLRAVAEDSDLNRREFNRAFVLMEYFGYLRRNPEEAPDANFSGYDFWLRKLNQFGGNYISAEMVKAFITSGEYLDRFTPPKLASFSNPADPLLLRAVTPKGEVVEYFGEKDTQGLATELESVRVKGADGKVTNISLDDQARPTQIQAFNGVVIKIEWLSKTDVVVTALSADGAVQVNLPVDLAAQAAGKPASHCQSCGQKPAAASSNKAEAPATNRSPRAGSPVRLDVARASPAEELPSLAAANGAATSLVKVSRCGTPVNDAAVGITVIPSSAPLEAYNVPGERTGPGQYTVSIPTQPSPGQGAEDVCKKFADVLSKGCDGLAVIPEGTELMLAARIAAIVSVLATPAAGAAVFAAITVGFTAARLYCATLGFSPVPGAPSLLELICGNISEVVDRFAGGELRLIPLVFIPGEGLVDAGSGVTAPGSGPFPTFNVDAGNDVEIVSFTTAPADPAPFQDYLAEALINCARPGTRVTISIVGTDGYSDSATATIQGDANVTLTVPGAEAGIVDTVTVAVSGGPTRQIVLVF